MKRLIYYLLISSNPILIANYNAYSRVLDAHYMTKPELTDVPEKFDAKCKPVLVNIIVDDVMKLQIIKETSIPENSFRKRGFNEFSIKYIYIENAKCIPSYFYGFQKAKYINEEIKGWLMLNRIK